MTVKNQYFFAAEMGFGGFVLSHTVVNEVLQTVLLVATIAATFIGIWRTLKAKK